jgi:hypothetical protein
MKEQPKSQDLTPLEESREPRKYDRIKARLSYVGNFFYF